jgi:hypothetical protein
MHAYITSSKWTNQEHVMKRIIFLVALFLSTLMMTAPDQAQAKVKHHKRHKLHHATVRTVYRTPREHGANLNGNVGVGVGPIHIGVGAGAGVGVH